MNHFKLIVILSLRISCNYSQSFTSILYINPRDCNNGAYYDVLHQNCKKCLVDTRSSVNRLQCICNNGEIRTINGCTRCPKGTKISDDGLFCEECPNNETQSGNTEKCSVCPNGYIAVYSLNAINPNSMQRTCQKCPENFRVSGDRRICIACNEQDFDSCECKRDYINCDGDFNRNKNLVSIEATDGSILFNTFMLRTIEKTNKKCLNKHLRSCQMIANFCALQNYKLKSPSACELFTKPSEFSRNINNEWYNTLPDILYHNTENQLELNRENAIQAQFSMRKDSTNSKITILLSGYDMNGTFRGLIPIEESDIFPPCFDDSYMQFGVKYDLKCRINVEKLSAYNRTMFYDPFLLYIDENGQERIFPIAVVNENILRNGERVNQRKLQGVSEWMLTRRVYSSDYIIKYPSHGGIPTTLIRYPVLLEIDFRIQGHKDGYIMPPCIRIRHKEFSITMDTEILAEFRVNYWKIDGDYERDFEVIFVILGALSIVISASSAYSWSRRAGKAVIDFSTILKYLLFECDIISEILFITVTSMVLFITFVYKTQSTSYLVLPNPEQEKTFLVYLITTTILKWVTLLHRNLRMSLVKTFFIDWERPRHSLSDLSDTRSHSHGSNTDSPVIWNFDGNRHQRNNQQAFSSIPHLEDAELKYNRRTYLISNEWNELQSYRKTSISIQLTVLLALLQYFRIEEWSAVAPGFKTDNPKSYSSSPITRYATVATLYLTIAIVQWIFNVLVTERILADRFHDFIDLCSIANISVISLTEPLHGYYIHGRSIHGYADTNMAQLNSYLQKERDNLCGERGLEPGNELQTFVISVPKFFKKNFDLIMTELNEAKANLGTERSFEAMTAKVHKVAQAHKRMNDFLMEFIEHNNPNVDYTIRDPSLLETILDIEFIDTTTTGSFVRDRSENAFTSAFFYGNEWTYLSSEILLFCCVDLFSKDFTLAASVTFILSKLNKYIFQIIFTNNLAKSSLVDHRFLV